MIATPTLDKARANELTGSEIARAMDELLQITPPQMPAPYEIRCRKAGAFILSGNGVPIAYGPTMEDALCEAHSAVLAELADA